jgi:transposase
MARPGPRKTNRYRERFKATAVRLSELPDVLVRDVADALDIQPFMLSRWRRMAREGVLVTKSVKLDVETASELKRLRQVEKEHALLKKASGLLRLGSGSLRVHRSKPGRARGGVDVSDVRRDASWLLRLARP